MKRGNFLVFVFVGILIVSLIGVVSGYTYSTYGSSQYNRASGLGGFGSSQSLRFDDSMCSEGTDFLLQIQPFDCESVPVRSDLLEEEDVTVFCKIGATQINPLIDVEAIDYLNIVGDFPREVKSVGYFPSQAALGNHPRDNTLNNPILENLGYVAITLRQNPNESSMPEFVEGNLTATLKYDAENAFGVGRAEFYLPVLDDDEFNNKINQYSFWQGKGYLRAESVGRDDAVISIYSGSSGFGSDKNKFTDVRVSQGETSNEIYLPGISSCLASFEVRLNGLEDPDTRVRLKVNSDYVEVSEGSWFMDNKCQVGKIKKDGLNQHVKIFCKEDDGSDDFTLSINPKISLTISEGEDKTNTADYSLGDYLYTEESNQKAVYLGYVGSKDDSESLEDLYVVLVASPEHKSRLTESELSLVATQMNLLKDEINTGASVIDAAGNVLSGAASYLIRSGNWIVTGDEIQILPYKEVSISPEVEFKDAKVKLNGFSEGDDLGLIEVVNNYFELEEETVEFKKRYNILEEGEETGLYLEFNNEIGQNPRVFLRSSETNLVDRKLGTFYGVDCDSHSTCSEYEFHRRDVGENVLDKHPEFFENLISAKFNSDEENVLVRKIDFDSSSGMKYKEYYDEAIRDFETIMNSFSTQVENENSQETYGERALYEAILLSERVGERKDLVELCQEFVESYPASDKSLEVCESEYKMSNSGVSSMEVFVNGKNKLIDFEGIYEPSYEDYGAEVVVQGPEKTRTFQLKKDDRVYLYNFTDTESTTDFMELVSVDEDSARVRLNIEGQGGIQKTFVSDTKNLQMDDSQSYGTPHVFTLTDTNIEKSASVSIIPSLNNEESESEFGFNIGIEKRAIQLSDDEINTRIKTINSTIEDWSKVSSKLNDFNEVMGKACLATGGYLTVKNFLANSGGKAIARQEVMRGNGGWQEICQAEVNAGNYVSLDDCYLEKADEIDAQVNEVHEKIQEQDEKINSIQDNSLLEDSSQLFGETVNTSRFMQDYSVEGSGALENLPSGVLDENGNLLNPSGSGVIDLSEMETILSYEGWEAGNYYVEDLRDIELYAELVKDNPNNEFYHEQLYSALYDVRINAGNYAQQSGWASELGINQGDVDLMELGGANEKRVYRGLTAGDLPVNLEGIESSTPVQVVFGSDGRRYFIALDDSGEVKTLPVLRREGVIHVYDSNGDLVPESEIPDEFRSVYFERVDENSYKNNYQNAEIRYYEEEPYKGFPAVVPTNREDGWYAGTKPKLGVGSQVSPYDESGRLNSFWLCNVGDNGREEFSSQGFGDDICQQINVGLPGQTYDQFYGLSENEASGLVRDAVNAIEDAQRAHRDGVSRIRINDEVYDVGSPEVGLPSVQCQDFMSPKECNLLFNVCDPVICPSSRCDFGGSYPVRDVVQSGIVGSLALCLPNAQEGIAVPICTTGVQAGIDSWLSVQESYQSCLQENLESGRTIGICDEIHSVYQCEFFWDQALPLAQVATPKILSAVAGENSRGGGEYLGLQSSWDNAQDSVDFFKQSYATEAYQAFQVRSVDEAGGAVCKNFASTVYPSGGEFFNSLTSPRSPPQFSGSFDENPLTSATNPPTSHYKVNYHIYAGDDSGAYYQVYLDGGSESSFYQDTAFRRNVDSGYVPVSEYASETIDFQAPSGYTRMCIVVNGQEECGFGEVSTSFAENYVNDLYLQEQSTRDVTSEEECRSGSASLYSIINPNVQDIAEDIIDPSLYAKGINRVCATNNPGSRSDAKVGTEDARWRDVGHCGDTNVRCWLDTDSVKDAIRDLDIEDEVLNESAQSYADSLIDSGEFVDKNEYSDKVSEIKGEENSSKKIELVNDVINKVFFSDQKAELYLLRGLAYGDLARSSFAALEKIKSRDVVPYDIDTEVVGETCDIPETPDEVLEQSSARDKVLAAAEKLDGSLALIGPGACYDAAMYIYSYSRVGFDCAYSDKTGTEYDFIYNGDKIRIGETTKPVNGKDVVIFQNNENSCKNVGWTQSQKINSIKPGDELDIVWDSDSPHAVIFISWIDPDTKEEVDSVTGYAKVFDWNGGTLDIGDEDVNGNICGEDDDFVRTGSGGSKYCKTYQYREISLAENEHPIYLYRRPLISGGGLGDVNSPSGSFSLEAGESYRFRFEGNVYSVELLEVLGSTRARMGIDGSELEMQIGSSRNFDLNNDGVRDIDLFLENVGQDSAEFRFLKVSDEEVTPPVDFGEGYVSPTFKHVDGSLTWNGDVRYKYFDGKWHWKFYFSGNWVAAGSTRDSNLNEMSDHQEILREKIVDSEGDYLGGLEILLEEVVGEDSSVELKTEKVLFNNQGVFDVGVEDIASGIKFTYQNKVWYWSFSGSRNLNDVDWVEVPSLEKPESSTLELTDFAESMILEIDEKENLASGAAFIFESVNEEEDSEEEVFDERNVELSSEIDQSLFTSSELDLIRLSDSCRDCGNDLVRCNEDICNAIGTQIGDTCGLSDASYYSGLRSCVSKSPIFGGNGEEENDNEDDEVSEDVNWNDPEYYEEQWQTYEDVDFDLDLFNSAEIGVFDEASSCNDCGTGGGNFCDKRECYVVGLKLNQECDYSFLSCNPA